MRKSNRPAIIAAIVIAWGLVGLIVFVVVQKNRQNRDNSPVKAREEKKAPDGKLPAVVIPAIPKVEVDDWTHKELLATLKVQGMDYAWIKKRNSLVDKSLTISMCLRGSKPEHDSEEWYLTYLAPEFGAIVGQYIETTLCDSVKAAREKSGATPHSQSWGRFVFVGKEAEVTAIINALPR